VNKLIVFQSSNRKRFNGTDAASAFALAEGTGIAFWQQPGTLAERQTALVAHSLLL